MEDSVYVREALARDERRIRLQRQGTATVFGGVVLALACWAAISNGVLVAIGGPLWFAIALFVVGVAFGAAAVLVIVAGVRRRRSGFPPGEQPGSTQGKANAAFDHDPKLNPTAPPYQNWTAGGGMMGGN